MTTLPRLGTPHLTLPLPNSAAPTAAHVHPFHLTRAATLRDDFLVSLVVYFLFCRRYNRQGRQAKNRRSRDSYSNGAYSRTQTVRNTGWFPALVPAWLCIS